MRFWGVWTKPCHKLPHDDDSTLLCRQDSCFFYKALGSEALLQRVQYPEVPWRSSFNLPWITWAFCWILPWWLHAARNATQTSFAWPVLKRCPANCMPAPSSATRSLCCRLYLKVPESVDPLHCRLVMVWLWGGWMDSGAWRILLFHQKYHATCQCQRGIHLQLAPVGGYVHFGFKNCHSSHAHTCYSGCLVHRSFWFGHVGMKIWITKNNHFYSFLTILRSKEFWRCCSCRKLYWEGGAWCRSMRAAGAAWTGGPTDEEKCVAGATWKGHRVVLDGCDVLCQIGNGHQSIGGIYCIYIYISIIHTIFWPWHIWYALRGMGVFFKHGDTNFRTLTLITACL